MSAALTAVLIIIVVGVAGVIWSCRWAERRHQVGMIGQFTIAAVWIAVGALLAARPVELVWDDLIAGPSDNVAESRPGTPTPIPQSETPSVGSDSSDISTSRPTTDPTPPSSSPAAQSLPEQYLMDLDPLELEYLDDGPITMGRQTYDRSVHVYCGEDSQTDPARWQVLPGYTRFKATVGIPDSDRNAGGKYARYTFKDQLGEKLIPTFSLRQGETKEVSFDLKGAVQLHVECVAIKAEDGKLAARFAGGLGDARMSAANS